jgi:hypothetical protein
LNFIEYEKYLWRPLNLYPLEMLTQVRDEYDEKNPAKLEENLRYVYGWED